MRSDLRDRLVLPILLPLGILGFLVVLLWGFSRLLLGVTATAATATATIVAGGILAVSAVAAKRTTIRGSTIAAAFGATAGIAMLAGGIALAVVGEREVAPEPGPGGGATLTVTAQNIAFDTSTIEPPADTPTKITFENRDTVPHNIAIYPSGDQVSAEAALFQGEIFPGPAERDYEIPPLPPGEYYFQCDVHPQMNGTVVVEEGGGGGGPGEEPGGGGPGPGGAAPAEPSTVVAEGIAFDTGTISLPAGQPARLTFENRDGGIPHNVAIYADASLSEVLFQGEIFPGPDAREYEIPPLEAGENYFQCDVHPQMNGTVTVA